MKSIGCALTLLLAGCVTPPAHHGVNRAGETDDQRIDREVFRENWLRPSVSQEDVDFFYKPFWKQN